MLVYYPAAHSWHKEITTDHLFGFGKNNQTKLKSLLHKLESDTGAITHTITRIAEEDVIWFETIYLENIQTKKNPKPRNVRKSVLEPKNDHPYFLLKLFASGQPIGGMIFFTGDALLSIAYRSFAQDWPTAIKLSASPSLYAEYLIAEHCHQLGFSKLLHGRDQNPYGLNSQIGVANFKLSAGCYPMISKRPGEKLSLELEKITEDILVFSYPESGAGRITEGYLWVSQENLPRYEAVLKYPDIINIKVLIRPN